MLFDAFKTTENEERDGEEDDEERSDLSMKSRRTRSVRKREKRNGKKRFSVIGDIYVWWISSQRPRSCCESFAGCCNTLTQP